MTSRKDQTKHDQMVKTTVEHLISELYKDIKADINGYVRPAEISMNEIEEGYIPDIIANYNDDVITILEIETEDTISTEHTRSQWELFSRYASHHDALFLIVVPKGYKDDAERQAWNWKINNADVIEI